MSDTPVTDPVGLQPKWNIPFTNYHGSLVRPMNQPNIDDDDGLVIFGDSTAIYLARVADPGQGPYAKLPVIKATTFIHGWLRNEDNLYVMDGVELAMWNLGDGVKRHSLQLVDDADVATAHAAQTELIKAFQRVEWATFLEQAEDEWSRLTAQQAACPSPSDERDRLDALAADYFAMLKAMRKMVGSTGGSTAARQKVAELRKTLADKRKAAAPWCFSSPVVRVHLLQEAVCSVFVMQGNGNLCGCDKQLTPSSLKRKNWKASAELQIAFLDEDTSAPKLVAYVSDSTIYAVDAKTLEEKSHWAIESPPAVNPTHSLTAANGQFWWSTDSGVYAFKPDDQSRLQLAWQSGAPWSTRQVGRIGVGESFYKPAPDANHLFECMNVHAWITQRSDKTAPLTDGAAAQLMLSDENGRYCAPPTGTTFVMYGPFSRPAGATNTWGEIKAHPKSSLVLLSDTNNTNILCRYPTAAGINQLLPAWTVSPSLSFVMRGSAGDIAFAQPWPAPPVRPRSKPQPDMVGFLDKSPAHDALDFMKSMVMPYTEDGRSLGERELRYIMWHAAFNQPFHDHSIMNSEANAKRVLDVFFDAAKVQSILKQFPGILSTWEFRLGYIQDKTYHDTFMSKNPPVDFDPPYIWRGKPGTPLFHKEPPAWYDPWGYNQPGDFIPQQPASTFLDPFCFDGQLKFPTRTITFDNGFKGQQWATFAASATASSDPSVLVVKTDEDKQQTTLYVLPPKHLIITYDAPSHQLHPEWLPFEWCAEQILGCPAVFFDQAKTYPAAWCAGAKEYPSARLRKIASVNPATSHSLWDAFVDKYKAQYGPSGTDTAWKIDECPLPPDVLPSIVLYGYLLPAPH